MVEWRVEIHDTCFNVDGEPTVNDLRGITDVFDVSVAKVARKDERNKKIFLEVVEYKHCQRRRNQASSIKKTVKQLRQPIRVESLSDFI